MLLIIEFSPPGQLQIKMGNRFREPGEQGEMIMPFHDHIFVPRRKITETILSQNPIDLPYQLVCFWNMFINVIAHDYINGIVLKRKSHRISDQKLDTGRCEMILGILDSLLININPDRR
jgi:hypothetical protein